LLKNPLPISLWYFYRRFTLYRTKTKMLIFKTKYDLCKTKRTSHIISRRKRDYSTGSWRKRKTFIYARPTYSSVGLHANFAHSEVLKTIKIIVNNLCNHFHYGISDSSSYLSSLLLKTLKYFQKVYYLLFWALPPHLNCWGHLPGLLCRASALD